MLERDVLESELDWKGRFEFDPKKMKLYDEYPLADRVRHSDALLNYQRNHPWEID